MDGNSGEKTDYSAWSQEKLIQRVTQLEAELKAQNRRSSPLPYYYKIWKLMEKQLDIYSSASRKEILEKATQ